MSCQFIFLEISHFNLDNFAPYMGWIGAKPVKIYTNENTTCYYLYEEESDRLFQLHLTGMDSNNMKFQYGQAVQEYLNWKESANLNGTDQIIRG